MAWLAYLSTSLHKIMPIFLLLGKLANSDEISCVKNLIVLFFMCVLYVHIHTTHMCEYMYILSVEARGLCWESPSVAFLSLLLRQGISVQPEACDEANLASQLSLGCNCKVGLQSYGFS